jgi:hypothetical protein
VTHCSSSVAKECQHLGRHRLESGRMNSKRAPHLTEPERIIFKGRNAWFFIELGKQLDYQYFNAGLHTLKDDMTRHSIQIGDELIVAQGR